MGYVQELGKISNALQKLEFTTCEFWCSKTACSGGMFLHPPQWLCGRSVHRMCQHQWGQLRNLFRVASFSTHDQWTISKSPANKITNRHQGGQIVSLLRVASFSMHDQWLMSKSPAGKRVDIKEDSLLVFYELPPSQCATSAYLPKSPAVQQTASMRSIR